MNRRLLVIAMLILLSTKPALAQSAQDQEPAQAAQSAEDNARLARVQSLLQALDQEKALSKNVSGEVILKNSLRDQLQSQGRLKTATAKAGVVCD